MLPPPTPARVWAIWRRCAAVRYEKWLNKSVFYGSFNLLRSEHPAYE